jgi:phage terminase large subunit-like protein
MALSNTAVPKYYGMFRDAVLRGEIPVNKEVSMEMNRIDDLIANPGIYYDKRAVEGWINYCENELTLTDGSDLHLLDSFKLWGEQVFGWYYFVDRSVYEPNPDGHGGHYVRKSIKKRLINKQYLIVGRGAAKTMYGSTIQSYTLNVDTSTTQQVTTAPTMKQAEEVLSPIRTSVTRARGPLFKFLTEGSLQNTTGSKANRVKLSPTKKGIENFLTGSLLEIRPMNIAKLQGRHDKLATIDEWLSGDIREDVIGAIEQGSAKVEDYLIIAISSEGTVRNGSGDTIKMELMDILKGDYINPHVSIWWYKLDSVDEVSDPDMWLKANPNLGKTVSYETYQLDVERAEKAPAARNDILAKRFGLPMEGYTYYFTYEETLPHKKRSFWKMPCAMGGDLSQGDDFCAFTFLFPMADGKFGVKTRNYISSLTLMKLPAAMRIKYDMFMKEGSLIVLDGTILDMMHII